MTDDRCDYCILKDIRSLHPDAKIELRRAWEDWNRVACYVDGERVASFAKLTDECAC